MGTTRENEYTAWEDEYARARAKAEALRVRVAELEDALRGIIDAHELAPYDPASGLHWRIEAARALIDAAREAEREGAGAQPSPEASAGREVAG